MRLIDADKLKTYLSEYLHYDHAIPWVDAQPTAYDLDKVAEQLDDYLFDKYCVEGDSKIYEIVKGGVTDAGRI